MKNRKQYMAGEISFEDYYQQFVTENTRAIVATYIGIEAVGNSEDAYMNDIPLKRWDAASDALAHVDLLPLMESNASTNHGGVLSIALADKVCLLKASARSMLNSPYPGSA